MKNGTVGVILLAAVTFVLIQFKKEWILNIAFFPFKLAQALGFFGNCGGEFCELGYIIPAFLISAGVWFIIFGVIGGIFSKD